MKMSSYEYYLANPTEKEVAVQPDYDIPKRVRNKNPTSESRRKQYLAYYYRNAERLKAKHREYMKTHPRPRDHIIEALGGLCLGCGVNHGILRVSFRDGRPGIKDHYKFYWRDPARARQDLKVLCSICRKNKRFKKRTVWLDYERNLIHKQRQPR